MFQSTTILVHVLAHEGEGAAIGKRSTSHLPSRAALCERIHHRQSIRAHIYIHVHTFRANYIYCDRHVNVLPVIPSSPQVNSVMSFQSSQYVLPVTS